MKTLLLAALAFTGIALSAPEAQARDRHHDRGHYSYRQSRSSYGYGYHTYRGGYGSRHHYYRPVRYYYRPSARYYYRDDCAPRYYSRRPLISFLFGF
jgi:hypothetical protein